MKTIIQYFLFLVWPIPMAFGWDGADGKSGAPLYIEANGSAAYYANGGYDGGRGSDGRDGQHAACYSTGGHSNVHQPSGDNGEDGGQGGNGGWGGDITVRYEDIAQVKAVRVNNSPGRGGGGGYGGRGGQGCQCYQSSWTVTDSAGGSQTYYCYSGSDGRNGSNGASGANGAYGRIYLAPGKELLTAGLPAVYVDMARMETGSVKISENDWAKSTGARALFAPNSYISDTYYLFRGRKEANVKFVWKSTRPKADFSGWNMWVGFSGNDVKVSFPTNALVSHEVIAEGGETTVIINSAVKTNEMGNISMGDLSGHDETTSLRLKDNSKVSDVVKSTVRVDYRTLENGKYKIRFRGEVPATSIAASATGLDIALGALGIDTAFLKPGLKVWIGLGVTRSLGGKAFKYSLSQYYTIRGMDPGALVEATEGEQP